MKVEVLLFAQLRDALGSEREVMVLTEGSRAEDVLNQLKKRSGWAVVASLPVRVAVNEEVVEPRHALSDGDRVAILTPVSGG